ncbi:hypothetical protein GCM10009743_13420 [Kribbella swartbergensis]
MNDNDDQSPYGRGFIAACIVIAAILLCGTVLLVTGLTDDSSASTGTAPISKPAQASSGGADSPETAMPPATPTTEPSRPAGGATADCFLPTGGQAIPTEPPSVDTWDVSRRVVVPRSSTYGPTKTDRDGFRRCFAHSPTGAVFAAYNVVAALADQRQSVPTVRKLMLPGPDTDALIRELRDESPSDSVPTQLAGFRVLDANQDRATIMLALPVESAYMSITLTLIWHGDDWRLQPPRSGDPVGSPFAQHRDLSDFVNWSGV